MAKFQKKVVETPKTPEYDLSDVNDIQDTPTSNAAPGLVAIVDPDALKTDAVVDVVQAATPIQTIASTLDMNQLVQLVAATVVQVMQAQGGAAAPAVAGGFDMDRFAKIIGDSVAAGVARNAPRRKISISEYEPRSPFHSGLKKDKPKLRRPVWQNGSFCMPDLLHDEEIELLNKITHSGRYLDRKVEVIVDTNLAEEPLYIRFDNRRDAAFELKSVARDFREMLRLIVVAQEAEDQDCEADDNKHQDSKIFIFGHRRISRI